MDKHNSEVYFGLNSPHFKQPWKWWGLCSSGYSRWGPSTWLTVQRVKSQLNDETGLSNRPLHNAGIFSFIVQRATFECSRSKGRHFSQKFFSLCKADTKLCYILKLSFCYKAKHRDLGEPHNAIQMSFWNLAAYYSCFTPNQSLCAL